MKFLKKDFTEAGYVLGVVQHAALSHPEIAFTLIRDGKQVFSTDGKGKLITPVFAVFGKEMMAFRYASSSAACMSRLLT